VLSAFYFGYLLTQVVGGALADRFGGKTVLGGGKSDENVRGFAKTFQDSFAL
jgi:MFS family permease